MKGNLRQSIIKEINNATNILDLCAGSGHFTSDFKSIPKIAVELNPKYNDDLVKNNYVVQNINVKDLKIENRANCTLWIDGIEHLEENDAIKTLEYIEKNTDKLLILTPNEFINNKSSAIGLNEPLQEHKSVFPITFWEERGYEIIYREYNGAAKVNNILYKKCFRL